MTCQAESTAQHIFSNQDTTIRIKIFLLVTPTSKETTLEPPSGITKVMGRAYIKSPETFNEILGLNICNHDPIKDTGQITDHSTRLIQIENKIFVATVATLDTCKVNVQNSHNSVLHDNQYPIIHYQKTNTATGSR